MNIQSPQNGHPLPRVVVVGAGFGGLTAPLKPRAPVALTIIDRRNHHVFHPLLYQVATAALSPADIAAPIRSVIGGRKNTTVVLDTVTGIDLDRRQACLRDLGHDWDHVAPGLKRLEDATAFGGRS
jgi:NADH:ubiquinone reductase (H+-translocating)